MLLNYLLVFFVLSGVMLQDKLTGFELLDRLVSGFVPSGESIVQAKTPFSPQLSICYWYYVHWARITWPMGPVDIRTTLTEKNRDLPSNLNWPSVYATTSGNSVGVQSIHWFKLKNKYPNINNLRKWSHVCYSFDFPANELQIALNGEVSEKVKGKGESKIYGDQLGGSTILQETENSNYFFAFGRYHFDDTRIIANYAGVNAWNRTLTSEELAELSSCEQHSTGGEEGNLLNSKTEWIYQRNDTFIRESEYEVASLLCTERNKETLIPLPIPLDTKENVVDICKMFGNDVVLGGTIRGIEDIEYFREVVMVTSSKYFKESCGTPTKGRFYLWLPYHYTDNETSLLHDITGEEYTAGFFSPDHKANRGNTVVVSYFGDMMKMDARLFGWTGGKACGMCVIPSSVQKTTVVKLRGVCKFSEFDKEYQVSMDENGDIIYYGYSKTYIQYNYTLLAWQMLDAVNPSVVATFESGFRSMALGTNTWTVENDLLCQKGKVTTSLSLSACLETQFTCGDGLCISIDERCDGVTHCKDMTDEMECRVIQMDSGYNKLLTPPPGEGNDKVPVTIDVTINSFNSFDISESKFELQIVLGLKWFDGRLKYNNLRPKKSSNVMGPAEKSSIWFPAVVFVNTKQKLKSVVDDEAVIVVEKKGEGKAVDDTFTENKLLYGGHENPIFYERLDNIRFDCMYQLQWYPFDTQKCEAEFGQSETMTDYVEQISGNFTYDGPRDLTMYFIKRTHMAKKIRGGRPMVVVEVTIGRRLLSFILTTILPTLLLNLIGHSSNYFKEFFFEGIISLNVTVMLVLTTMFINVSNNLPKTAYLKMIDTWLLFNLFKPFVDIIMQTYIETLRNEDSGREVNHHGKTVTVGENTPQTNITMVAPAKSDNAKM